MADYIDKNDLREYISGYIKSCNGKPTYTDMDAMVGIISLLEQMPAADVQPKKYGRWTDCTFYDPYEKSYDQNFEFKCSYCGHIINNKPNDDNWYCGHCGADMRGETK